MRRNTANASSGAWFFNRSILLTTRIGLNRSAHAALSAPRVCMRTPSIASTTSKHPSARRHAAHASCAKSTWPGESMIVRRKSLSPFGAAHRNDTADALNVIPRSCSSGRSSINRSVPASRGGMAPLSANNQSTRELLPWSTCPITQMVRSWAGSCCNALISVDVGRRLRGGGGWWAMVSCDCRSQHSYVSLCSALALEYVL